MLVNFGLSRAKGWLDRVGRRNPARALGIVVKLAEYITPKMNRTEHTGAGGEPLPAPVFAFSMEMGGPGVEGPPGSDAAVEVSPPGGAVEHEPPPRIEHAPPVGAVPALPAAAALPAPALYAALAHPMPIEGEVILRSEVQPERYLTRCCRRRGNTGCSGLHSTPPDAAPPADIRESCPRYHSYFGRPAGKK